MDAIMPYERALGERFLATLPASVTLYGLPTLEGRVPTFLLNVDGVPAERLATHMAERGIGIWAHDSWYSLNLYRRLGYEGSAVRVGFIHYNTADEVDRFVAELAAVATE
jgi:selenocysteine lyase/cysteine desulfurase